MDRLVSYLDDDGASETWTLWHLLLHAVTTARSIAAKQQWC
jgi:hypothetical protein